MFIKRYDMIVSLWLLGYNRIEWVGSNATYVSLYFNEYIPIHAIIPTP